jgi:hypothetical protein
MNIAAISIDSARKICRRWHYSKTVPQGGLQCFGVWENNSIVGCVVFGYGASSSIGKKEGFESKNVCELVRVAFSGKQKSQTSKYLMACVKKFKSQNNNIKAIYSFADLEQNHIGVLYQACNWMYLGIGGSSFAYFDIHGKRYHSRHIGGYLDKSKFTKKRLKPKNKYIYVFCKGHKKRLSKVCKPYPK